MTAPHVIPMNPPAENSPVRDENGNVAANQPQGAGAKRIHRPSALGFTDVAICIGSLDKAGQRQEIVHQIDAENDNLRITNVNHSVKEKTRAVKEDGQLIGFEPTGEYEVTLKFSYFKE